jgi:hypothetical protein
MRGHIGLHAGYVLAKLVEVKMLKKLQPYVCAIFLGSGFACFITHNVGDAVVALCLAILSKPEAKNEKST